MVSPITRRLQSDYEKVQKLVNESGGSLSLIQTVDSPPRMYVIEFHCPSLVKEGGQINIREVHQVQINLGFNYPLEKPTARMLTPVFNPHVFITNAICLGVIWSPTETLDTLILRIGALLQLDPRVLDAKSPANTDANDWVKKHPERLPLGQVSFKTAARPEDRINWSA